MTEDEMIGWHHRFDGHEFEQALGVGDGQGSLVCCSPWGSKESDTTERLSLSFQLSYYLQIFTIINICLQTFMHIFLQDLIYIAKLKFLETIRTNFQIIFQNDCNITEMYIPTGNIWTFLLPLY